jgi:hypothetical protein
MISVLFNLDELNENTGSFSFKITKYLENFLLHIFFI